MFVMVVSYATQEETESKTILVKAFFIILTVKTPIDHNSSVHIALLEKDGSVGYGYTFWLHWGSGHGMGMFGVCKITLAPGQESMCASKLMAVFSV